MATNNVPTTPNRELYPISERAKELHLLGRTKYFIVLVHGREVAEVETEKLIESLRGYMILNWAGDAHSYDQQRTVFEQNPELNACYHFSKKRVQPA